MISIQRVREGALIRLQQRIQVRRPCAECFRYMLDASRAEQWNPAVSRARKQSGGAAMIGSRFQVAYRFGGREYPFDIRLEDVRSGSLLCFEGKGPASQIHERIEFEPDGDVGTRILYTLELDFERTPQRFDVLLQPWLKRLGRRAARNLRQALGSPEVRESGFLDWLRYRALLPAALDFTCLGYRAMPDHGLSDFIDGRIVVITGATSGIGLATARELSRLGATLILVGRGQERLAHAEEQIRAFSGCGADALHRVEADLSRLESVREAAARVRALTPRVHVLINNAGGLFANRDLTAEGIEQTLAVNLLAPYLLTEKLLPVLCHGHGRVINVASGGLYLQGLRLDDMECQQDDFDGARAYARSKRALVAQTEHWAVEYPEVGFYSMHPGWVDTPGLARSLPAFHRRMARWLRSPRMGADTLAWLASSPSVESSSGRFWFDRRPRPTAVLPGTRVGRQQRQQLADWLAASCLP